MGADLFAAAQELADALEELSAPGSWVLVPPAFFLRRPSIQLSIVDLGGITSSQAYRLLGEEVVKEAHVRAIRDTQRLARAAGCECSWTYCRSLYTVVRFVEAEARA